MGGLRVGEKGIVMDGEKKGELWLGKGGWIRVGKRRRVMSGKKGRVIGKKIGEG